MEGQDFQLYNKCLFRTIEYNLLKTELISRKVNFTPTDTYYIMTLRLRKDILEKTEPHNVILENIGKDLDDNDKTRFRGGARYNCRLPGCPFETTNYKKYLAHLETVHRNSNMKHLCQYRHQCEREFSSVALLKSHLKRDHTRQTSSVVIRQNLQILELTKLKCREESCGHQTVSSVPDLKKHLYKSHTDKKEEIQCIFCNYKTDITSSLQSHLSRKHKIQTVNELNTSIVEIEEINDENPQSLDEVFEEIEENVVVQGENSNDSFDLDDETVETNLSDANEDDEELFIKATAIMFNSWMNIKGIAWVTVQSIVQEVFASYDKGIEFTRQKIRSRLMEDGFETKTIEAALDILEEDDPFSKAREVLEDETKRKRYIYSTFPNVRPQTVQLNPGEGGKPETLQYVPIHESIKLLLEDKSYIIQKNEDPYFHEDGVVKDVRDGACFRENEFFKNNPDAVPLVLFMDELELCNPLGSGKTKHKILCSYFTSLDIQPALRSKVNSIQLVSLVLSRHWKKHGNEACNRNFVDDMKRLEVEGVKIEKPYEKTVKVGLAFLVGDNLGQHSIAEMSTSFSSGQICRWCKACYRPVCQEGKCYAGCDEGYEPELWSVESYDEMANKAEQDEGDDCLGIKGHCTLNQLRSFHCVKQLPPCLGHDFYEGQG